jgi:GNAT superfamily N-acetyltransferase
MIAIRQAIAGEFWQISHFQEKVAMETENIKLDPATVQKGVKAVLSDPSKGCYYIAELNGRVAGSLLITYEWSDWRNSQILWIQSVYVLPEYRNKGVFRQLYAYIKEMVEEDINLCGIRLYVDKTNHKALQVYRSCGMNGEHYRLFEWMKRP